MENKHKSYQLQPLPQETKSDDILQETETEKELEKKEKGEQKEEEVIDKDKKESDLVDNVLDKDSSLDSGPKPQEENKTIPQTQSEQEISATQDTQRDYT